MSVWLMRVKATFQTQFIARTDGLIFHNAALLQGLIYFGCGMLQKQIVDWLMLVEPDFSEGF